MHSNLQLITVLNRLLSERGLLLFTSTVGLLLMLYNNIGVVLSLKCDYVYLMCTVFGKINNKWLVTYK